MLNDDGLPKLRISPTYRRMLDVKDTGSEETRNYVTRVQSFQRDLGDRLDNHIAEQTAPAE